MNIFKLMNIYEKIAQEDIIYIQQKVINHQA